MPAILYGATGDGGSREATAIAVEPRALLKILHSESGANTLISSKLAGAGDARVLIKEYQLDPVTYHGAARRLLPGQDGLRHPGHDSGRGEGRAEGREAAGRHPGVRAPGRSRSSASPRTFLENVEVDVSEFMLHQGIRLRDIVTDGRWTPVTDSDAMLGARDSAEGRRGARDAGSDGCRGDRNAGRTGSHQEG